ncbi:MAG TPA: protein kinase [Kofleriaceae bacterium]|nr:protein kinase [Kofleriaceae bacterium]
MSALNEPFVGSLHLARARDGMHDRLLVLKILGPRLTEPQDIARFRAEASAILVSYSGEVKLGDFSLALSAPVLERTEPEVVYGKVPYLSPEQARAEPLDGRSDLYSAGIVLWEMLTGRQLFPSSRRSPARDLRARTLNPEVTPPSKRAPRVPAALDEICLKALAADQRDRYAGCTELAQALQTWLAHNAPAIGDTQVASFMGQLFPEASPRDGT